MTETFHPSRSDQCVLGVEPVVHSDAGNIPSIAQDVSMQGRKLA